MPPQIAMTRTPANGSRPRMCLASPPMPCPCPFVLDPSASWLEPVGKRLRQSIPKGKALDVACMTGDYAVQNVIKQIGLNLVGTGGKKMAQVKSWVLRCHACFK
jgi:hypothetical protein